MGNNGSWIFLSHSSKDIRIVRQIRNILEENNLNPLAFHLKCLSNDTEQGRAELDGLIKREIDSRDWFIYCDSPAARASEYVAMEREYIQNANKKKIWEIDVTAPIEKIKERLSLVAKFTNVVLVYQDKDKSIADNLLKTLRSKDYSVIRDIMVDSYKYCRKEIKTLKKDRDDCVVFVLTGNIINGDMDKIIKKLKKYGLQVNKINKKNIAASLQPSASSSGYASMAMCQSSPEKNPGDYVEDNSRNRDTAGYEFYDAPQSNATSMRRCSAEDIFNAIDSSIADMISDYNQK